MNKTLLSLGFISITIIGGLVLYFLYAAPFKKAVEAQIIKRWLLVNDTDKFTNEKSCLVADVLNAGAFLTRQKDGSATYFFPPSQSFIQSANISLSKMRNTCIDYERDIYTRGRPEQCLHGAGKNFHYVIRYFINGGTEIKEKNINTIETPEIGGFENTNSLIYMEIKDEDANLNSIYYDYRVYMLGFYILNQKDHAKGPEYEVGRGFLSLTDMQNAFAISSPCVASAKW